jgi:cysteine-rich repeat protein
VCGNAIVGPGEQCDDGNAANGEGCDNNCVITAIMYIKASNTAGNDVFGHIALSAGGSTLAVAASGEDSAATGTGSCVERGDRASQGSMRSLSSCGCEIPREKTELVTRKQALRR